MRSGAVAISRWLLAVWIPAGTVLHADSGPVVQSGVEVLTGYEDRRAESWYSEAGVKFRFRNRPAFLDLDASGNWFERFDRFFGPAADHRYSFQAGIGSSDGRLQWRVTPSISRTLSADTTYNTETGQGPSEYLRNDPTTTRRIAGELSYRIPVGDGTKTDFTPYYSAYQADDQSASGDERRSQNEAGVRTLYRYSERTGITGESAVQEQSGSFEKGQTARIAAGAAWKYSEKTSFSSSLGWIAATYDKSGSAQSPYFDLKGRWQATEKTSTYLFGGNYFRPGLEGGGAEMVWRMGAGADWRPTDTWRASVQLLHENAQPLANEGKEPEVSDYLTAGLEKKINKYLAAFGRIRYALSSPDGSVSKVSAQLGMEYSF